MAKYRHIKKVPPEALLLRPGETGFTLLEVIIVASLMVTVVAAAYALLQQGVLSWQMQADRREARENLRVALARIGKYAREAAGVKVEDAGAVLTLSWYDPDSSRWKQVRYQVRDGALCEGRRNKLGPGWVSTPNPSTDYVWKPLAERVVEASFAVEQAGDARLVHVRLLGRDRRGAEHIVNTRFMARVVFVP
jgi:type II secretory pathway pseudopilin PulG